MFERAVEKYTYPCIMIGRCIDLSASAASRIGEKSDYLSGVTYWTNPYPQQTPPIPHLQTKTMESNWEMIL